MRRTPSFLALLLVAGSAFAGPIARLAPVSAPMSRPATLALQTQLRTDPAFISMANAMPSLGAVLSLSPDRARDRQALGPLAARLPLYYDAGQLSLAMMTAPAAAQAEVAGRVQRAVRTAQRGDMSRRAFTAELESLQAYALYGEPAAEILGTVRLASARLAAGERTQRVARALMSGVRDDLSGGVTGDPERAVYGEYGRAWPGPALKHAKMAAQPLDASGGSPVPADGQLRRALADRVFAVREAASQRGYTLIVPLVVHEWLLARFAAQTGRESGMEAFIDAQLGVMMESLMSRHSPGTIITVGLARSKNELAFYTE